MEKKMLRGDVPPLFHRVAPFPKEKTMTPAQKVRLYEFADQQFKYVCDELLAERLALPADDTANQDLRRLLKGLEKPRTLLRDMLLRARGEGTELLDAPR